MLTYPDGVEWNGGVVKLVVGIAAKGEEHLEILGRIVEAFAEEADVEKAVQNPDVEALYKILVPEG